MMGEELKCRPYQKHLEDIAVKRNTIINLPTGSGKTFIAISVITRLRGALQLPWGQGGKRTFFLVNTVPLVTQQKKAIEGICPVNGVGAYSGESGVDYWDKDKWDYELGQHQVIVMTSQILFLMLTHGYIRIEDINLIIFDECHHAVDDHSMRVIMKYFEDCPLEDQPRVLGLTATLINSNLTVHQVETALKRLETTFHATISTVNEMGEVLPYSTNPYETVVYYDNAIITPGLQGVIMSLNSLIDMILPVELPQKVCNNAYQLKRGESDISVDVFKIPKKVRNMIVTIIQHTEELGAYGASISILAYIILLERLKRKTSCEVTAQFFKFIITHLTAERFKMLKLMEDDHGYDKILKHSSPKILKMLNLLKEFNPEYYEQPGATLKANLARKPLSGIIFTQQRFTAKVLYNLLKGVKEANPAEFDFLRHDFIVGFNVNPFNNTREQYYLKKASQKALLMFAKSDLNCLISTSVIEEGVDIPQCLLVMKFDPPTDYRSYIQSKGRARSKDASFIMMINNSNRTKFSKRYREYQQIEQHIQKMLVGADRDAPTEDDIQNNLYDDDDIPPYVTKNGNRLPSTAAISLLNRYLSVLPHDHFTVITAAWIKQNVTHKGKELKQITIILPLACPIKDPIESEPYELIKTAKRSAALQACIRLHQAGELDEHTLLPNTYAKVNYDEAPIKQCLPLWPWDGRPDEDIVEAPNPGTKKNVRRHKIAFPKCLRSRPGSDVFYLHLIKLTANFPEPSESRERALYKFIQSSQGYGFLTQQPLPKICAFPSFVTSGEVTTEIVMNFAIIKLNEPLFELVKRFHLFIFDQVLAIAKKFVTFEGKENCVYVVPVTGGDDCDIDWPLMQQFDHVPPVETPPPTERRNLNVTPETYQYSVVTPWYRGAILPDRYIVSNVLEHMTPRSMFDSECSQSYADYYSSKYNLDVIGPKDQPLLEVRNISSKMNCLLPRAATIKTFTDKQKRLIDAAQGDDKPRAYAEIFIPEFCIKYEFPGLMWYKSMMLPTILHRVHMLLVAQELIVDIARDINYGTPVLPKGEQWLPIEVNMTIVVKSLMSSIESTDTMSKTVDRINNPTASPLSMPNTASMKDSIFALEFDRINDEYPWKEDQEPVDIERNLTTATVMDIECYDEFVDTVIKTPSEMGSPLREIHNRSHAAAIKPPPPKYVNTIKILNTLPTGRGPELRDVLAALTTIKTHDAFCLERAETLGDSFLKFAVTLYLYHKFPEKNEGQLTNIKCRMISNRNLYYAGERINLGGRMKVDQFGPRKDFILPGFFVPKKIEKFIEEKQIRPTFMIGTQFSLDEVLSGEILPDSWEMIQKKFYDDDGTAELEPPGQAQNAMQCYLHSQAVADKSVADSVEALIGTYLLSGGILAAVKITEWLKIIPECDNFDRLLHKRVSSNLTVDQTKELAFILNGYQAPIEEILNYKFKDSALLLEAISHASYIRNRLTRSYERLEFLGDAVLDFLITCYIFECNPLLSPGDLTNLRSALVNNVTFAAYVVKLGLQKYICKEMNPVLDRAILHFVEHQTRRHHEIVEDILYLIDEEECQMAEYIEVPKTLSDIFESLIGAIYLDSGGSLATVWAVVYRIMRDEIQAFSDNIPRQPVAVLYEMIHACPIFGSAKVIDPDTPKIMVPVTVTAGDKQVTVYGVGGNKSQAKRAAAKLALKVIQRARLAG